MQLDLTKVIRNPGESVDFEINLEPDDLEFDQLVEYRGIPHAEGVISNTAGVVLLTGKLTADTLCACDRCASEFDKHIDLYLEAVLSNDESEMEDPDIFPVEGESVDVDEIVRTLYMVSLDTKFLCKPDCKGLCGKCGKNLNEGPCNCTKELDPRMAVLGQLLDNKEQDS